ncbi:hypothetical protein PT277_01215 [Acetobacteraceae bacterium ESL0709]|nr:hypothetical protein [Acetobacteraceae bacterium ESL0697]MDF7677322.1 hypothetical protein [Acetobacteraceae bacterium ESL0709]
MKRLWFGLSLVILVSVIAWMGIYRNSALKLHHAVEQLQAALPPHTVLTYRSAVPSFLVRGVTLRDVTFKSGHNSFHASFIRLGHPQFLHDGKLVLSSLILKNTGYKTSKLQLDIQKTVFRHLIIPAAPGKLDNDLTANSMRSLATLLAFNPENLASLRFARTHIENLHLQFTTPIETPYKNLTIRNARTDSLTLEGYGLGKRIFGALKNLSLGINITRDNLNSFGTTLASTLLFPEGIQTPSSLPATLSFSSIEGKEGMTRLLQHPFKGDSKVTRDFWEKPLDLPWSSTGSVVINNTKLAFNETSDKNSATLDTLYLSRRDENDSLRTELFLKGFHIRPSHNLDLPFTVNGAEGTLRATLQSRREDQLWQSDATAHLSLDRIGDITLNSHYSLPYENPFYQPPRVLHNFARNLEFNNTIMAIHGDHFVDLGLALARQVTPEIPREQLRETITQDLTTLGEKRSFTAPLADYVRDPHDRTLNVSLGTLSSAMLSQLPLDAPAETIIDALHVTSINAR